MDASRQSYLSRNLSWPAQVAQALELAGQALLAAASAIKGEASSSVAPPLPLSPLHTPAPDNLSVAELINEFLRAKARQDRSDRYLRAMRVSLSSFAKGRRNVPAGSVTLKDVEAWLDQQSHWAPRTKLGYLRDVRTLYNWGKRRNLVASNPAAAVDTPAMISRPPAIHTPEQVRQVLEYARHYDLNICRALAIRYFSGLRSAETDRLEESEIGESYIEVKAAKSKTRQRRLVAIQPNLRAWLNLGGQVPLHDLSNRWRWWTAELKKETGIDWPPNVTRHSFCSYHLVQFGSASKTALEAGHLEQMLFAHYRELVTPPAAAAFWAITPK